jgi:hypothetical protein
MNQIEVTKLQSHPMANLIPAHTREEYETLKADIAENGIRDALHLTENNVVLAGHTRLRIAKELGHTTVPVKVLSGMSEAAQGVHMVNDNVNRRHLSTSQRAFLLHHPAFLEFRNALEAEAKANMVEGGQLKGEATSPQAGDRAPQTRDKLAKLAGISPRTVQEAKKCWELSPERAQAVLDGSSKDTVHKIYLESTGKKRPKDAPKPFKNGALVPAYRKLVGKGASKQLLLATEGLLTICEGLYASYRGQAEHTDPEALQKRFVQSFQDFNKALVAEAALQPPEKTNSAPDPEPKKAVPKKVKEPQPTPEVYSAEEKSTVRGILDAAPVEENHALFGWPKDTRNDEAAE